MSVPSRLVATSRALWYKKELLQCASSRRSHVLSTQADEVVNERVWQVGEVGSYFPRAHPQAGPSTWQEAYSNDRGLNMAQPHPPATTAAADRKSLEQGSFGSTDKLPQITRIGMRSHLTRPRDLPPDARALLKALESDEPPDSITLRRRIHEVKSYHKSYMVAEIGRHLARKQRAYAGGWSEGPPWNDAGRALFKLLLSEGADIPSWRDAEGRLQSHHPITALLNSLARHFKFHSESYPTADRNAAVLLDTLRQLPPGVRLAPDAIVAVLNLLPMSNAFHLLKAHLLTALLLAIDGKTSTTPTTDGSGSGEGLSREYALLLQEAIKRCTPVEEWKSVPDILHQALLQAWKVVIDYTVDQEAAETPSPEHFTPAFLSLLLKLPGNEGMHLPELLNAMRTLNLAITPFQTQLVLRYDSFLAPWISSSGLPSEVLDKAWEGLHVRRKMQAAVDAHKTGTSQELRGLELAWGEVVMTSYEAVRALTSHEEGAEHPSAVNEVLFWEEQVNIHQQRWRTLVEDALRDSPDINCFSPANMQGQALWLLLRHRLLVGSDSNSTQDPLSDPHHLFQLSIGAGHRTNMQHIRVVSCLIRLVVHYRSDITRLVPCLSQVATDTTIKLPALLHQRILAACTTRRDVIALLPALLQLQPPEDEDVFIRNKELKRLVSLSTETQNGLGQLLTLFTHWRVNVPVGRVTQILSDYRARSESLKQAVEWEATRGE